MALLAALLFPHGMQAGEPLPDGKQLARTIRELIPEKNIEIRATMEVIERERKRLKTGIVIRVEKPDQTEWCTTYEASRDGKVVELWRVCHELGQANRYEQSGRLAKRSRTPRWLGWIHSAKPSTDRTSGRAIQRKRSFVIAKHAGLA